MDSWQPLIKRFRAAVWALVLETSSVARDLFRILIPVIVLVKIAAETGIVVLLAAWLSPLMAFVGLSGELGIVWATALLTNLYGGIAALLTLFPEPNFTVREITTLCLVMLVAHSLPVELALTHRVGGHYKYLGPIRFLGALMFGALFFWSSSAFGLFDEQAVFRWPAREQSPSIFGWLLDQLYNLGFIVVVLFFLLSIMRILDALGINRALSRLLAPLLKLFGISHRASTIALFGLLAGITFGSGLLLAEVKKNEVSRRDIFLVLVFLSLCHGVVEDTILMLLLGASIWGVLVTRVLLAFIVVLFLSRLYRPEPEENSPREPLQKY